MIRFRGVEYELKTRKSFDGVLKIPSPHRRVFKPVTYYEQTLLNTLQSLLENPKLQLLKIFILIMAPIRNTHSHLQLETPIKTEESWMAKIQKTMICQNTNIFVREIFRFFTSKWFSKRDKKKHVLLLASSDKTKVTILKPS